MNAYTTHNDVTAWWFCRCRRKNKTEAGAVKQAEADFIKNPYTSPKKESRKFYSASESEKVSHPEA
jgi:hypothetical protein